MIEDNFYSLKKRLQRFSLFNINEFSMCTACRLFKMFNIHSDLKLFSRKGKERYITRPQKDQLIKQK